MAPESSPVGKGPAGEDPNLTTDQVEALKRGHVEAAKAEERALLGKVCRDKGLPLAAQVQNILRAQAYTHLREEDLLLGKLAVRHGFASDDQVRQALTLQDTVYGKDGRLPKRLGEILVEQTALTDEELQALLEVQTRLRRGTTQKLAGPGKDPGGRENP